MNLLELQLLHPIAYFLLCCYLSTQNLRSRFCGKCWNQHNQLYSDSKSYSILVERYEECRQRHQVRGSTHLSLHPASQEYTVLISCLLLIYYTAIKSPTLLKFCGVMKCLSKICAAYGKTTKVTIPYTTQLRELTNSYEKYI